MFLGPSDLKEFLSDKIISGFKEENIKQAAYELSLGSEVYRTDAPQGKIESLDDKNKTVEINPGQFILLLTKETVNIPPNKLAFISIKAKHKLKGLVNVSGFHVDPGFHGKLLFSVYNAGPSTLTLKTGIKYFLIWFAELKSEASKEEIYNKKDNHHQGQDGIDPDYIDALKKGEMASPSALMKKIDDLQNEFSEKIKDVERKKLRNEYLLTVIIGFFIALFVKVYWDSKAEEAGYQKRIKEEEQFMGISNQLDSIKSNSVSLSQVDSLIKKRSNAVNEKPR
ncbi:hypothetical protein LJ707_18780 [Mucilaginibacter sp. UR6-1]|uniref:dCTP deaminase domain-containing protein n=1 Tax=Mucilaginibacter sp. UR6-1 TaxID=1435643 RepID=UPI001E2DF8BB|nr:hypothetical protein [Mucilaginibacter sp. UR6-1]MCC8410992.1 hypothetical protein [Mucilaginibacter sp. UR6-1]